MSQDTLARQIGVDRTTVYRWERGRARPDNAQTVRRFAEVLKLDLEEVLAAAGLRPVGNVPTRPAREPDPDLDRIRRSKLSEQRKRELTQHILARRTREAEARLVDLEMLIRVSERGEES